MAHDINNNVEVRAVERRKDFVEDSVIDNYLKSVNLIVQSSMVKYLLVNGQPVKTVFLIDMRTFRSFVNQTNHIMKYVLQVYNVYYCPPEFLFLVGNEQHTRKLTDYLDNNYFKNA